jgi:hypothetical protein
MRSIAPGEYCSNCEILMLRRDIDALVKKASVAEDALISTTAHLVGAVSLLRGGGKKAAASDKIFYIMIDDYEKSIAEARKALDIIHLL